MKAEKAFLLSAGLGTRFKPQSLFLPKPAMPFLNLPQAVFPAAALKLAGVSDFFYNSHHLPKELNSALSPYFKRESIFEKEILDSAGGIANAQSFLEDQENFWVANGDSLVFLNDDGVLSDAYRFHLKQDAAVTMIGIQKPNEGLSGLEFDKDSVFTGISKSKKALHFIGFYIFNKSIFKHLKNEKQHIFHDVLLKNFEEKAVVFDAGNRISWYETGNEKDFIHATSERLSDLKKQKEKSQTYKSLKAWNANVDGELEHFLGHKVWGSDFIPKNTINPIKDFLCIGKDTIGDFSKLNNSVLGPNLKFESNQKFDGKVLVHSSQWT